MIVYKYDNKEYTSLTDLYKVLRENNVQIFGIPTTVTPEDLQAA